MATPENFEDLQRELTAVLAQEIQNTGTQKQRMTEESEKGLEQARRRIEQVNEQHRKEQEKREAEERRRQELEERAKALTAELARLVDAAEGAIRGLAAAKEPLDSADSGLGAAAVARAAEAVEAAGFSARAMTRACTDFVMQHGQAMKDQACAQPGQPSEVRLTVTALLQRIGECTRASEMAAQQARGARERAARRVRALEKTEAREATFRKYDRDRDGRLSKKEVLAYAAGEFGLQLPEAAVQSIWKVLVEESSKGVDVANFQRLRIAVGVERECQRDAQRRGCREEREKALKGHKKDLHESIKQAAKAVDAADKDVAKAEKQVQPLTAKAKTMPVLEMVALADDIDGLIAAAREAATAARAQIDALSDEIDDRYATELRAFLASEAKQLEIRMGRMDSRLSRATNLSSRFREQAGRKRTAELEKFRSAAVRVVRRVQQLRGLGLEGLLGAFGADGAGGVSEGGFLGFFASAGAASHEPGEEAAPGAEAGAAAQAPEGAEGGDGAAEDARAKGRGEEPAELGPEVLSALFAYLLEDGAVLSRQAFERFVRICYKAVTETAVTSDQAIKDSRTTGRLEVGDVVELLEGPVRDPDVGVLRIRARVAKDGTEGWISVVGNQGTVFLEEGGGLFRVLRETALLPAPEAGEPVRRLREGEVVEVHEWPRPGEGPGPMTMKVRAKSDGALGWMAASDGQGTVNAEPV